MWNAFVRENIVKPAIRRLGTIGATALIVGGEYLCDKFNACGLVTESGAHQVMAYVVAVALLCVDLVVEWMSKKGNR